MRHYNPSICSFGGRLLCAYRVQDVEGHSSLGICRLNAKLQPIDDRALVIPAPARAHLEDPRLIEVDGRLLLFVCQIDYTTHDWKTGFLLRCFELDPATLQPGSERPLPFGKNGQGACEKNWMPFALPAGGLGLVYSLRPHIIIHAATGEKYTTPGIERWKWGTLSGRTNAIALDDGSFLAVIGGHVVDEKRKSLYWAGAYRFSPQAPHAIFGITREPLFWASERTAALLNPFDPNWNPIVVFPAGLMREKGNLLVSLGVNDSFCDFLRLDLEKVLGSMIAPENLTGEERILAPVEAPPIGGLIRVRVTVKQPVIEPGGPYRRGDEFFTSQSRVHALGKRIKVLSP